MKIFLAILIFLLVLFGGPLYVYLNMDSKGDWWSARRSSAGIAPSPESYSNAVIQVYAAKAFNWRGVFGVHTWFSLKRKNAETYTVLHVLGWRSFIKLPVVSIEEDIPDRYWFNHEPILIGDIRGEEAEKYIPQIEEIARNYPYQGKYIIWPGPNSNTFTAYIARRLPELHLVLPSLALGKDFLPFGIYYAPAPSGTGYQYSFLGLFGFLVAEDEGIELNILGLIFGVNFKTNSLKIPGFGEVEL